MHFSSKALGKNESESEAFNIATKILVNGYPPIIEGVISAYFCDLNQEIAWWWLNNTNCFKCQRDISI